MWAMAEQDKEFVNRWTRKMRLLGYIMIGLGSLSLALFFIDDDFPKLVGGSLLIIAGAGAGCLPLFGTEGR